MRATIYVRLSQDREGETSTARQEADCRKWAEAKGWTVGEVYRDLQSAYSDKERPGFERMLRDATDGRFDMLIVWKFDRMARSVLTFERAVRTLMTEGVQFASLSESVDTTTPMGKFMLHLVGALAQLESDTISYRVKNAMSHRAQSGKHAPGGRLTFGYNRDGSVNQAEAELLREAAGRFLAGESLSAIVKGWNAQGITTPPTKTAPGNEWGPSVLGRLLARERIAGLVRHDGSVYPGTWEPIIDMETHLALLEALEDSRRRSVRRGLSRNLLTGIARCGVCGAGMGTRTGKSQGGLTYVCVNAPGRKGCGKVRIVGRPAEELVREAVFETLARGAAVPVADDTDPEAIEAGLHADRAALDQLARDHYVDRLIGRSEFLAARKPLQVRVAEAEAALARSRRKATPDVPADLAGAWEAEDVEWRRKMLSTVLDHVTVNPAKAGTNSFDASRLDLVWRQ